MTKLERIIALMHRSLHPTTPVEESRTSAILALRIAQENNYAFADVEEHAREMGALFKRIDELQHRLAATEAQLARSRAPRQPRTERIERTGLHEPRTALHVSASELGHPSDLFSNADWL